MNVMKDAAFGIVPILMGEDGTLKFLLIQHWAGHWGFPKGHAEPGETAIATALRELSEETGVQPYKVLDDTSFSEDYTFERDGQTFDKTVTYFIGLVESEMVTTQEVEIQDYAWVNFDTAMAKFTFERGRLLLREIGDYLAAHPLVP
jgi:bis(5'-nucleosidyl)-tetraphosphatase